MLTQWHIMDDEPILVMVEISLVHMIQFPWHSYVVLPVPADWSGYPDPNDPDNFWIDDVTGKRIRA